MRFYQSPLYGVASRKHDSIRLESFYFHHLGVWGITGILLYFILLFSFFLYMKKKEKKVYWCILIMSFVLCFSTPIFDQVRLFNIFYALLALFLLG
jgi:hypothetical protein